MPAADPGLLEAEGAEGERGGETLMHGEDVMGRQRKKVWGAPGQESDCGP